MGISRIEVKQRKEQVQKAEAAEKQRKVNNALEEVIMEARQLSLPISSGIIKNVVINKRAKSRFGCCKRQGSLGIIKFQIELSEVMLCAPEKKMKQTLAHEILHTCKGCYNHSPLWKSYAEKMNRAYGYEISRTATAKNLGITDEAYLEREKKLKERKSPEMLAQAKYLIVCEKCGAQIPRQRLSSLVKRPYLYRCKCGGTLKRRR